MGRGGRGAEVAREDGGQGVVVHVAAAIEELYGVRPIVLAPPATQTIVNAAEFPSSEVFTVYPESAAAADQAGHQEDARCLLTSSKINKKSFSWRGVMLAKRSTKVK